MALMLASRCPVNPISLFLERAALLTQRGALINLSAGMKKKLPLKTRQGRTRAFYSIKVSNERRIEKHTLQVNKDKAGAVVRRVAFIKAV